MRSPTITNFDQLIAEASRLGPRRIAIVGAEEHEVLLAAKDASEHGFARCVLVGNREAIQRTAEDHQVSLHGMSVLDEPGSARTIRCCVDLAREGEADILMKGSVNTGTLLSAVLNRDSGLRTGRLLSHVGAFDVPGYDRFIFITDGGVNISPVSYTHLTLPTNREV